MRFAWICACIALLAAAAAELAHAADTVQVELFRNGSFEHGTRDWRPLNMSGGTTFEVDTDVKDDGKQSLRVDRSSTGRVDFLKQSQDLWLPGVKGKLEVSLSFRVEKGSQIKLTGYFFDAGGEFTSRGELLLAQSGRTKKFEQVKEQFDVPEDAVGFGINVWIAQPGTFWIDSVSVLAEAPTAIVNGGFEDGLSGWRVTTTGSNLFGADADSKRTARGKSALRVERQSHRALAEDGVWAEVYLAGKRRKAQLSVQCTTDGARSTVVLQAFDARGVCVHTERVVPQVQDEAQSGKYVEVALSAALPKEAERMRVYLLVTGHGSAWFDDVELTVR